MAGRQFVKVEGLQALEANLKRLREEFGVRTGGIIIRGLRAGARLIRDDARRRVGHVPSGYTPRVLTSTSRRGGGRVRSRSATEKRREALLRSRIVEYAIPTASKIAAGRPTVVVRVSNAGYDRQGGRLRFRNPGSSPGWWWWLEFGTSKRPAQPFLRPAFEAQKVAAVLALQQRVRAEIDALFINKYAGRRAA